MDIINIIQNPVLLKLDLMIKGVRLPAFRYKQQNKENYSVTIEGIELELENRIKVRVPYYDNIAIQSPYMLDDTAKAVLVDGHRIPVKVVEDINLSKKKTSSGITMSGIAHSYNKYLVITPNPACGFFGERLKCAFCPSYETAQNKDHAVSVDDVLETVREVCRIRKPSTILLSIGAMDTDDAGIGFAEQYLRAIHKHFNVMGILEISPPKDTKWIETAYGAGADAICFNIDVFDERLFDELCPGKSADNGRNRYINALRYASSIFPRGTVLTHLIVGLEPLESTINGIEYLASAGVVPILSIFRPVNSSMMKYYNPLSVEEVLPVYRAVHCSLKRHKIPAAWTKYMGFAITPAETKLFTCRNKFKWQFNTMIENSGVIDNIKAGILRVRRSLRVKEV